MNRFGPYFDPALRAALSGATIITTKVEANSDDCLGDTLALVVKTRAGQLLTLEIWRDDEGNGPGALVCTKAVDPPLKPARVPATRTARPA